VLSSVAALVVAADQGKAGTAAAQVETQGQGRRGDGAAGAGVLG
jgi:hypothetical protein